MICKVFDPISENLLTLGSAKNATSKFIAKTTQIMWMVKLSQMVCTDPIAMLNMMREDLNFMKTGQD